MAIVKEVQIKLDSKSASKNLENLTEQLEIQKDVLFDLEKQLFEVEEAQKSTSKTNLAAQKKLADQSEKLKNEIKREKQGLKELNYERGKATKVVKETTDAQKDSTAATGQFTGVIDKYTGGAVTGFKNMATSIGTAIKGMNLMKVAIIGTGIGALVIGILAVVQAFKSSEEGQNKFAKIMAVIGSVTGNLSDILSDLGESIISVFEDPKQAIIDFKDAFVKNITNRISSAIETVGFLGTAIKKVFSGDFTGAMGDAKKAGSSYIDTLTGVKGTIDKVTGAVKNMTNEITNDAKVAANIADQRARADKLERKLIVDRAEANRKRAELLEKAVNKEIYTTEQRIEFLKEAGRIEDEITSKEIQSAKLRLDSKIAENSLSKSTAEDLKEEAELKANLINLETAKLTKAKEVTSQTIALNAEEAARLKAIEDAKILEETERVALRKEIRDAEANTIEEKRALDLIKEDERFQALILKAQEKGLATEELEKTQKESLAAMRQSFLDADVAATKAASDLKTKTENENADALLKIEQDKKATRDNALQNVINIAGAESKIGKALLVAKQILALKEMIMEAKKALTKATLVGAESSVAIAGGTANTAKVGFPWNIPLLIGYGVQAAGIFSAIKAATGKTKTAAASMGASGGGGTTPSMPSIPTVSTPSAESLPPAFNVVGASGTNQLASAIGNQSQQPTRAYVVSKDVTTSQEMDRNIINGASI